MSVNEKMTAIANAIRKAIKDSAMLDLDAMAYEINRLVEPEDYWASIFNNTFDGNLVNSKVTGSLPANFQSGNKNITGIDLPLITTASDYLCYQCSNLTFAKMYGFTTIKSGAFQGCHALTKLYFPSATAIDGWGWALSQCNNLEKIYFPKLTSISCGSSFRGNPKLVQLILGASTVCSLSVSNILLDNTPISNGTGYIYVPSALVNQYKAATNWSVFASQFRAIEDYPGILEGWND